MPLETTTFDVRLGDEWIRVHVQDDFATIHVMDINTVRIVCEALNKAVAAGATHGVNVVDELDKLAPKLDKLHAATDARLSYCAFAGALHWSDEWPEFEWVAGPDGVTHPFGLGTLRALLNYRSSLIVAEPRVEFRELWNRAMTLCPNWPGFLPERRAPALAVEYQKRRDESMRAFAEFDARFQQSQPATANVNTL